MKRLLTFFTVSALSFSVMAQAPTKEVSKSIYSCDNNKVMEVVYINTHAGHSYAIINQMDEMIPMEIMKMASGANYQAMDKNYTYKLYTKGKHADLVADNDTPILSNCVIAN